MPRVSGLAGLGDAKADMMNRPKATSNSWWSYFALAVILLRAIHHARGGVATLDDGVFALGL